MNISLTHCDISVFIFKCFFVFTLFLSLICACIVFITLFNKHTLIDWLIDTNRAVCDAWLTLKTICKGDIQSGLLAINGSCCCIWKLATLKLFSIWLPKTMQQGYCPLLLANYGSQPYMETIPWLPNMAIITLCH